MAEDSEENLKEKARKTSITEGAAFSIMDGFGYKYITPFALSLGANSAHIGFLSSFPNLLGSFSQIFTLRWIEKHSRKKIVMASVLLQGLMWLPLVALGILYYTFNLRGLAPYLLIFFYSLIILFGGFAGPAWHSWMKDLTEKNTESYFGKRSVIVGVVATISMFIAAFILDFTSALVGFSVIFAIAFIGRLISVQLFKKQYEPKIELKEGYYFTLIEFVKKMRKNNFGNYVLFAGALSFATAIASPFFAVYMLEDLQFNYTTYMMITLSSVIFSLISLPQWGKLGDKYGNVKILKISGSLIFLVPLLWLISSFLFSNSNYLISYLILIEIFSGIIWAGFGLSSSTFVFHVASRERLALCFAYSGIINAFGAFIGAALGGYLANQGHNILSLKPILFVFLLSSVLRFLLFIFLSNRFKEVRPVANLDINVKRVFTILIPQYVNSGIRRIGFANHI